MTPSRAQKAFNLVCRKLFNGDVDKTNSWFNSYHNSLGCTPVSLMKFGSVEKLVKWVKIQLDDNLLELKKEESQT
jgi:hypothetical protein